MGGSINEGTSKWMDGSFHNSFKMDDLGVPLFLEPSTWVYKSLTSLILAGLTKYISHLVCFVHVFIIASDNKHPLVLVCSSMIN